MPISVRLSQYINLLNWSLLLGYLKVTLHLSFNSPFVVAYADCIYDLI